MMSKLEIDEVGLIAGIAEGVNPALLGDSVYNLAIDGQRPIFNILQFTTHYKKMTSLRNVMYKTK